MGWRRRSRACVVAVAAVAGLAMSPSAASAQTFPLYPKDKFIGNANDFTVPPFTRYFNQLIPENAGKWGSAAGTTRTAAMRWTALDQVIGLQAHAFEFIPGVTNAPTILGHPYVPQDDMRVHKANLDRLAATGIPIDITELDLDGLPVGRVAGDEMQLRYYRNVVPTFWEHPAVRGITLWGWRAPNHWRNAQNAPIALANNTLKPAGAWLFDYVNGIAPVVRPGQAFTLRDGNMNRVGVVEADDWASKIGRPELRTFKWRVTGGSGQGIFAFEPSTGELRVANPHLLDENSTDSLEVRVSDGFHESAEQDVAVVAEELGNVVDTVAGGAVPATLALALGASTGFGAFTPGVADDYGSSAGATVISTAGEATLSVADPATTSPGRLTNGAFSLPQPVHAAVSGAFAPVSAVPLTLHSYTGPVSNGLLTVRFRQSIGASEPLRTGAHEDLHLHPGDDDALIRPSAIKRARGIGARLTAGAV